MSLTIPNQSLTRSPTFYPFASKCAGQKSPDFGAATNSGEPATTGILKIAGGQYSGILIAQTCLPCASNISAPQPAGGAAGFKKTSGFEPTLRVSLSSRDGFW
jgi:hypothetical protein